MVNFLLCSTSYFSQQCENLIDSSHSLIVQVQSTVIYGSSSILYGDSSPQLLLDSEIKCDTQFTAFGNPQATHYPGTGSGTVHKTGTGGN